MLASWLGAILLGAMALLRWLSANGHRADEACHRERWQA